MSKNPFDDDWVPAQVKKPEIIDLRPVAYGPRGFKVKNKDRFAAKPETRMELDSTVPPPVRLGTASRSPYRLGTGKARLAHKNRGGKMNMWNPRLQSDAGRKGVCLLVP